MRILLLINKPQARGAEIFARDLSRQLTARGHDTRIAALYRGATSLWSPSDCLLLDGDEQHWCERVPGFHPGLLRRLVSAVACFGPDVIQVHGSRTVKYGSLLRHLRPRGAWILIYRNIGSPSEWLRGRWRRRAYRRLVMSQMDGVVAVSDATKREIGAVYKPRVPVIRIPRGIDLSLLEAGEPAGVVRQRIGTSDSAKVVLFVGHLGPEKRPDRFLEVVRRLGREGVELEAWLLGEGPQRSRLESIARSDPHMPPVRFLGARSQVSPFMAAADVLLLTSDTEGLPGVLLEAGALGLPVVATRVGGVEECVLDGRTGLLVLPVTVEGLAEAVLRLLADPAFARRLGQRAQEVVRERFAIETVADRYLELYRALLDNRPPAASLRGSRHEAGSPACGTLPDRSMKGSATGGSLGGIEPPQRAESSDRGALKILFVMDGLWVGGTERSLVETVPHLEAAGITCVVACLRQRDQGVEEEAGRRGLDIRHLVAKGLLAQVRAVRRLALQERPQILHSSLFRANLVTRLAAIGLRARVLVSLVNTPYEQVRFRDPSIRPRRLRRVQQLDRLTSRLLTDRFHAVSHAAKAAAVRDLSIPPARIVVVERGRDPARLGEPSPQRKLQARRQLDLAPDAEIVLSVGRQDFQKGQRYLLLAIAELAARRPRLEAVVAGREGSASGELLEIRERLGLSGRVHLLGHREDLPTVLAAADLFVLPSLFEGLPGAAIEAMALGLPVVASDIPPVREIVEHERSGLLVPPEDPLALASAMDRMLSDPNAAESFGSRGRQLFIERYTADRSAARMAALYRDLLNCDSSLAG